MINGKDEFENAYLVVDQLFANPMGELQKLGLELQTRSFQVNAILNNRPTATYTFTYPRIQHFKLIVSFIASDQTFRGGFVIIFENRSGKKMNYETWLQDHDYSNNKLAFWYKHPLQSSGSFVVGFFNTLVNLFQSQLQDIATGRLFEETPIDWQGYK